MKLFHLYTVIFCIHDDDDGRRYIYWCINKKNHYHGHRPEITKNYSFVAPQARKHTKQDSNVNEEWKSMFGSLEPPTSSPAPPTVCYIPNELQAAGPVDPTVQRLRCRRLITTMILNPNRFIIIIWRLLSHIHWSTILSFFTASLSLYRHSVFRLFSSVPLSLILSFSTPILSVICSLIRWCLAAQCGKCVWKVFQM